MNWHKAINCAKDSGHYLVECLGFRSTGGSARKLPGCLRNLSIRSKFLLAYIAVFVAFLFFSFLVFYPIIRRNVEANIEDNLKQATAGILNTVKTAGEVSIQNYLKAIAEKNRDIIAALYRLQLEGKLTEKEAKERAKFILLSQTIGKTGYIYCINSKRVIEMHPVPEFKQRDMSQYQLSYDQAAKKEGYMEYKWKNPGDVAERNKAMYMAYFKPWDWIISVSSYREEFKDLVDVNTFRDRILALRLGKTGYIYILNSRGDLILHPILSGNRYQATSQDGRKFVQEICAQKNGRIVYEWRNPNETEFHDKLAIFNYIPEFDWIVVSVSYESEFYKPLRQIRNSFLVIVSILLAVVFLLARGLASYIVGNLNRALDGFRRTGAHDFSARLEKTSEDEFGKLADGFNDAMAKLDSYDSSLKGEIHQRKKAEEDLLDANEKYKSILRAATGFSIIGTDTRGIIKVFNTGAELMLGYKAEELIDKATPAVIHAPEEMNARAKELGIAADVEQFANSARRNLHETREWTYIRKDGTRFPVLLHTYPQRDRDGNIIGFLGIASDITERKRFEAALRAQKLHAEYLQVQAEAANRAKSAFLANMSHELRTPLNVIMASADVMLTDMLGMLNSRQTEYLGTIKASSRHLLALINDILNIAKIESGKMELELKSRPALEIIRGAVSFVQETAEKSGVRLTFSGPAEPGPTVRVDETRFRQILYNLLSNAIKFTHSGGQISVTARTASLEEIRQDSAEADRKLSERNHQQELYLEIKVADSGIGIKPEDMDKLFKQFSQVESSYARNYEGTGLGLVISRKLVELHKGWLWAESVPDKGSTFTLALPCH